MKFDVEIDLNYPGIENDTPEMRQHNLQIILERGAQTINDENQYEYGEKEEEEECTCSGTIIRTKPMIGLLVYYKKIVTPDEYQEPTPSMFEDYKSMSAYDMNNMTYEEFCVQSKKTYEDAKMRGYAMIVQTTAVEYNDAQSLEQIKEQLKLEEGFIGFQGDAIIDVLHQPIQVDNVLTETYRFDQIFDMGGTDVITKVPVSIAGNTIAPGINLSINEKLFGSTNIKEFVDKILICHIQNGVVIIDGWYDATNEKSTQE